MVRLPTFFTVFDLACCLHLEILVFVFMFKYILEIEKIVFYNLEIYYNLCFSHIY